MSKLAAIALRELAADLQRQAKRLLEKAALIEGADAKTAAPAKKAKKTARKTTAKKAPAKKVRKVARKAAKKVAKKAAAPARETSARSRYAKSAD